MNEIILLDSEQISLAIKRLARQLIEEHDDFSNAVIIGLQPRGVPFANRVKQEIEKIIGNQIPFGSLDITFHRDDFRKRDGFLEPSKTDISISLEDKHIILADDVLYTGRSVRAAMDAVLTYGRPAKLEFMSLIDRRFSRHIPIQADYVGRWVDSIHSERVSVVWGDNPKDDHVKLYTPKI